MTVGLCGCWKTGANPSPVTTSTTPIAVNIHRRLGLSLKHYFTSLDVLINRQRFNMPPGIDGTLFEDTSAGLAPGQAM